MNQENHPKEVRLNNKGANQDVDKSIVGANAKTGEYLEGRNLRVSSVNSQRLAGEKIKGEEVVDEDNLPGDYVSMLSDSVNGQRVVIWVDKNGVEDPLITVDGITVAKSEKIPFLFEFPMQHDINESCVGGEIFITDNNSAPITFNIKDMVDSLIGNPTKYFDNFNPSLYSVNLEIDLGAPIFKELVNVGGVSGLPIGTHAYSFRYVTEDGDRTDWTLPTPLVPVLDNFSSAGDTFPYVRTFGAEANPGTNTNLGIKIKFRINNSSDFDFIEVRRQSWIDGIGDVLTPNSTIVAKIDITNKEISVKEFVDPVDSNVDDAISEEDEINKLASISRAKGIRYHDKRLVLMNVNFESRETDGLSFNTINSQEGVPIVKKLGKAGHKDPFNHAYFKRFMSGEKFGFAVVLFGATGNASFAEPIPGLENFQFPNRRDVVSTDGKALSYTGMPTSATVSGSVDNTFEIIDLENAVRKTDKCSFKNISEVGSKTKNNVEVDGCDTVEESGTSEIGYKPYTPVSQDDTDISGLNYVGNIKVDNGSGSEVDYQPYGFAPNYYTNGIAIPGIDDIPSWATGFSIVRTEAAERVIASGIGMYSLNEGDYSFVGNASLLNKNRDKMWFHSEDLISKNPGIVESIKENPEDFKIQIVSSLGFFSEIYTYKQNVSQPSRDRIVDMITYARVLHDEGQINPTESAGMGVGSGGKRYVSHNRYRNSEAATGNAFGGNGNKEFSMASFNEKVSGNSSYFEVEFDEDIYNHQFIGSDSEKDFNDSGLKDFTEPFYVINIINTGAEIKDANIKNYKSTNHFQKLKSVIGKGDGLADQSFELVHERWEDCIPDLSSGGPLASGDSYLFMEDALGVKKRWINVTYRNNAARTVIINDIINNGFYEPVPGVKVEGLFTHTNSGNRDFSVVFNIPSFYPTEDDTIVIEYDKSRPTSVFGGDSIVGEQVFCPIDTFSSSDNDLSSIDSMFIFNAGFPFREFRMNPRHYVLRDGSATFNRIQDSSETSLGYIRQQVVAFHAESRAAINFTHNIKGERNKQSFPLVNYVMRPLEWDGLSINTNNVFSEYADDYGTDESANWARGGFRFGQQINNDYGFDGPIAFFGKPQFGFEEVTDFCTAVVWSLPRAINVQDSPGLRTFTSLNRMDISDDQGAIKKAYDATTGGKGENLYAVTEKGVCLLLTKKSILSNIDSDDLTSVSSDDFVSGEYWLSKEIGSNDEFWRGMGERTIGFSTESGSIQKEVLIFPNRESVFSLVDNQIKDILRPYYHSRVSPMLKASPAKYGGFMTGFINNNNNEYWLDIEGGEGKRELFVYGNEEGYWEGTFDYSFDKYFMSENEIYGSRDLKTFKLESGFQINDENIVYELTTVFSPGNLSLEKEFIRIGVQTGKRGEMKPSKIEFYDESMELLCSLDNLGQGSLFLKQYDGWEQFISRKDASVSPTRDRVQYRTLVVKIIHDKPEDFKVVSTTIQYKIIK